MSNSSARWTTTDATGTDLTIEIENGVLDVSIGATKFRTADPQVTQEIRSKLAAAHARQLSDLGLS